MAVFIAQREAAPPRNALGNPAQARRGRRSASEAAASARAAPQDIQYILKREIKESNMQKK